MKTTINKLRKEIEELAEACEMLNGFYWKDLLRAQSENNCEYPLMTVFYTTGAVVVNQDRIQLEISVCDKIDKDWNFNLDDVESDTLNIQRQIFNAMQSPRWKQLGRIESAAVRKFIADGKDYVAGHTMTLSFLLRDTNGICDVPIFDYDFDQVVDPSNTVNVFNSDMSYSVSVEVGTDLQLPDILYQVKNSLGTILASATVPSVNNIDDTLPDVDNVDGDGSIIPTPAGVPFVCTPDVPCADGTVNVNKSNAALIAAVPVASGATAPYNVADSTAVIKNTDGTTLITEAIRATESEDIIAPDGTAENTDSSYSLAVPSGATAVIIDSNVEVNTVLEGTVISAKTIEVVSTQAAAPYAPDTITILGQTITLDFAAAVSCPVGAELIKTGQTVSYAAGDDGDTELGRYTSFLTLDINNPHGNTFRFTDELGTQVFANNIIIDWSTYDGVSAVGWYKGAFPIETWTSALTGAAALTVGGFAVWRIPNVQEALSIMNYGASTAWNYAPFNIVVLTVVWTSNTYFNSMSSAIVSWVDHLIAARGKTSTSYSVRCRTFTNSDLGL